MTGSVEQNGQAADKSGLPRTSMYLADQIYTGLYCDQLGRAHSGVMGLHWARNPAINTFSGPVKMLLVLLAAQHILLYTLYAPLAWLTHFQ